jgi:hypothetical protein
VTVLGRHVARGSTWHGGGGRGFAPKNKIHVIHFNVKFLVSSRLGHFKMLEFSVEYIFFI